MTLSNVIRAEWIKLWSVRSTWWTLFATYFVTVGLAAAALAAIKASDEVLGQDFYPIEVALFALAFGQLAMAVTGVLVMSSEYSSGGIWTTLTAVPNRMRLLAGKGIVLAGYTFAAGAVITISCFVLTQVFFGGFHGTGLSDPGVLRATLGGAAYLMASALLAFGLAGIIRNTGGSITATVALLFIVPLMTYALPGWLGDEGAYYFTVNAGFQITLIDPGDGLAPGLGYLVFLGWAAVAVALAAITLQRRDA